MVEKNQLSGARSKASGRSEVEEGEEVEGQEDEVPNQLSIKINEQYHIRPRILKQNKFT